MVKAVIVSTEAFAENSLTNDDSIHMVSPNGYRPGPFQIMYISIGKPVAPSSPKTVNIEERREKEIK